VKPHVGTSTLEQGCGDLEFEVAVLIADLFSEVALLSALGAQDSVACPRARQHRACPHL